MDEAIIIEHAADLCLEYLSGTRLDVSESQAGKQVLLTLARPSTWEEQ